MKLFSVLLALVASLPAQEPAAEGRPKAVALIGGLVVAAAGREPKPATVLIEDGRIVDVGTAVAVPDDAQRVLVDGLFVMPAFIDVGSDAPLPREFRGTQAASLDEHIADLVDKGSADGLARELCLAGVGAVYVDLPNRAASEGGTGALVSVSQDGFLVLEPGAGATFSLGSRDSNASMTAAARRGARSVVKGAADGAERYRKSRKKYEDDRKKYEKDLADWVAKSGPGADAKKAEGDKPKEEKPKEGETTTERGEGRTEEGGQRPQRSRQPFRRRPGTEGSARTEKAEAGDKPSARPKPPAEPAPDPGHETMIRVLDGKGSLRIEAHWKEDIEIAIDLAKSYKIPLVLLGATEAHLMIEELKGLPVVVVPYAPLVDERPRIDRGSVDPGLAATLERAGIPVAFGSLEQQGLGTVAAPRAAALSQAAGLRPEAAFRALTESAASALGKGEEYGRVEKGRFALLQVRTKADPFAPDGRVRYMVAGGEVIEVRGDGR